MHAILNKQTAPIFAPYQDLESKHLLWDYLHTPEKWFQANLRYSNSVIMSVVFGKRCEINDPDAIELFETSSEFLANVQPTSNLVDTLPVLENIPEFLQWWRPRGERAHQKCLK